MRVALLVSGDVRGSIFIRAPAAYAEVRLAPVFKIQSRLKTAITKSGIRGVLRVVGREFGRTGSYVDLSLFQIVEGLRYAFPKRMKRFEKKVPRLVKLHGAVAERPLIAAHLQSERRISFNEWGIFRAYRELDG